ncbi:heterokaryon incompatibility protein het-E-1 [Fusarium pseudocircinatum]|uniref:Heterokaryon incompatibility protein het-E-1 n=1 Tax=Fusarium pseudocircinatum TaxID=56676 RepID=A0A8H5KS02_9HYPO|nr:heterokaryon incompatibility protein het-E-1 [Fusarium pseudocircinatum]
MKYFSKIKKKLRPSDSDSAGQQSPPPASVPSAASTSQFTTPSCHQSTKSSLNVPLVQLEWAETTVPEELQSLEHCKSPESRQMWRLVYSGLEKSKWQAKHKESISTIFDTIENIKGVVNKAVKYSSEAAIAWAGVSLGLEILSNPMKEPGLNRKGIAYVVSRMEWYWNLAELVLQDNSSVPSAALRNNLESQIIEFYKTLLLFQMRSACLYYRNWAVVILRDAIKLDDWFGELNSIKDAESLIRKDIEQYGNEDIRLKLRTTEMTVVRQADSLESICMILREEARLKQKNEQDVKDKDCLAALLVTDPRMDKKRIQSQKGDPLKESYDWILKNDHYQTFMDDASSRVLWINGPPGKGKTMLLCGIIDELQQSFRPISVFLCQANVKEEDLSSDIAVMRGLIYVLLEHQPSLISAIRPSYDKQKDRLFNSINSSELLGDILTTMLQDPSLHDAVLLVDALDECKINRPKLVSLVVRLSKSCNTKWIVSSRDWPEIRQELSDATGLISLDFEKEHEAVSQAVKLYINKRVDDLAKTKWKNDSELKEKVFDYMQSHADDTFLWVALVCERLANSGIGKRLVIEELVKFPTSLGALYQAMMDRIADSSEADRLKQILALVCLGHRPLTSAEVPTLVESMDDYDEGDVKDAIASCGSFLTLQDGEIFFVHQSAKEFLLDQGHESIFPYGESHQHAQIFSRSVEVMEKTLRQDIYELESPGTLNPVEIPSPDPLACVKYSCVYWAQHLCKSDPVKESNSSNLKRVLHFLETRFTSWLEALSLMKELSTAIRSIMALEAILAKVEVQELNDFTHDAHRFISRHKPAIEMAPLQVYASALIFSPQCSIIRQQFSTQMPGWTIVKPEMESRWDNHTQTIYALPEVEQPSYSPDGRYLAICDVAVFNWRSGERVSSLDQFIRDDNKMALLSSTDIVEISSGTTVAKIWDLSTSDCKHAFDWDVAAINSVVCSSDGHWVAAESGFDVRLWCLDDTQGWIYKHDLSHEYNVTCLTFSADSRVFISGSLDNLIRVWDETGACVEVLKGHTQPISFLSVCGDQLASISEEGIMKLWDLSDILSDLGRQRRRPSAQTSNSLFQESEQSAGFNKDLRTDSLLFSPTGSMLGSLSYRETHIWDTMTDSCTNILFSGGPSGPDEVRFTPDGRLVAMKDLDGKLGVWDTNLMMQIHSFDSKGHGYVAISANGGRVALLSGFGAAYGGRVALLSGSGAAYGEPTWVLETGDLIQDSETPAHLTSEILQIHNRPKSGQILFSEDWKFLVVCRCYGQLEVLHQKSGCWVNEQLRGMAFYVSEEIPLAFSRENEWLLTYNERLGFAIRKMTSPYVTKEFGSLQAKAPPYNNAKLEKPFLRIPTRYGLLEVGEPGDFKGTRRIGWGLSIELDWIMRGDERMLWIPDDYRRIALDINASRVAFVCPSGQIKIMRFQ